MPAEQMFVKEAELIQNIKILITTHPKYHLSALVNVVRWKKKVMKKIEKSKTLMEKFSSFLHIFLFLIFSPFIPFQISLFFLLLLLYNYFSQVK